jgi:hypothetical protein
MGWTPPEEIITVDFTGTRFEGLDVKVRDVETGHLLEMVRLSEQTKNAGEGVGSAAFEELITMAADMIVEWDMEVPEGNPVPPTKESFLRLRQRTALPLVMMIIKAIQDVKDDLKKESSSGGPYLAALPMTAR